MTLIASYSVAEHPVILGDLLVSRWLENPPEGASFNVPTHTDANRVLPREWGLLATGLRQKIALVADDLAIAWSGSQFAARWACRELEAAAQNGPLSLEIVKAVLDGLDLGKLELALLGLLVIALPGGRRGCYRFAWQGGGWIGAAVLDGAGVPVYALGSGSQHFLENIRPAWESVRAPEAHRPEMSAILSAASIIGILSGEQMRRSSGLVGGEMYGGGFEIATVVEGKVQKVGDITYYLLDAMRSENGRCIARFRRAISYRYERELLFVSTIELQWQCSWSDRGGGEEFEIGKSIPGEPAVYVIAPVHREISVADRRRLEASRPTATFPASYVVLYVHLPQRDGIVQSLLHYSGTERPAMSLVLEGTEAVLTLRTELLAKLARHL